MLVNHCRRNSVINFSSEIRGFPATVAAILRGSKANRKIGNLIFFRVHGSVTHGAVMKETMERAQCAEQCKCEYANKSHDLETFCWLTGMAICARHSVEYVSIVMYMPHMAVQCDYNHHVSIICVHKTNPRVNCQHQFNRLDAYMINQMQCRYHAKLA